MGYYNMEKEPKGAKSSDMTGQKKMKETNAAGMSGPNSLKGTKGMSGEKLPKGANASDETGERKMPLVGGVAITSKDSPGTRTAVLKRSPICLMETSNMATVWDTTE